MEKKSKLYDHSGQPISPSSGEGDGVLTPGVQALIETRINTAIDDLREGNRADLKELSRDHAKKWRFLAIISSVIVIITIFYAPDKIVTLIGEQIDKRLTEPMLISSADRLIETKMNTYVSQELAPLNEKASELKSTIDRINQQIIEKQSLLEEGQIEIQGQLHIQELAIASKAGSKNAYSELIQKNENPANSSDLLTATIKEIELFYDADRGRLSYPVLVKVETMQDPGYAVDEVVNLLRNNKDITEAAINTLSRLKSKATVSELYKIVLESEDLRAITRAIRAIEIITDEKMRPLDFKKARTWWEQNKDKKEFLGNYDGYCEVVSKMSQSPVTYNDIDEFIENLSITIDNDSMSLHSKCLKAGFLIMRNRIDDAKKILAEVKKAKSDYYWYFVWEASLKIKEGDLDGAVNSVNSALKKSPTSDVVATIKYWQIFDPIEEDAKISWPNNVAQPVNSADPKGRAAD